MQSRTTPTRLLKSYPHAHRAGGWSLVEMTVAIAIIILIAGIVIVTRAVLLEQTQVQQTRVVLQTLQDALVEFEVSTGQKMWHYTTPGGPNWTVNRPVFQLNTQSFTGAANNALVDGVNDSDAVQVLGPPSNTGTHVTMRRFVFAAWQSDTARQIVESVGSRHLIKTNNGFPHVVDAWGTPIYFAREIQPATSNTVPSDDRFRPSRDPVFISAGPDREFGDHYNFMDNNESDRDVNGDGTGDSVRDDVDNIYSTDI